MSTKTMKLTETQKTKLENLCNIAEGLKIGNESILVLQPKMKEETSGTLAACIRLFEMFIKTIRAVIDGESEKADGLADINILSGAILTLELHSDGAKVDGLMLANQGFFRFAKLVIAEIVHFKVKAA
jgi:hypothetical protein